MSDFEEENYLKSMILNKNKILKSTILKRTCTQETTFWFNLPRKIAQFLRFTSTYKKQDFEKKINFKKHDFEKNLHTRNHVLVQFTPQNAQFLRFTSTYKKQDFEKKINFKKHDFKEKFFSKKHEFE